MTPSGGTTTSGGGESTTASEPLVCINDGDCGGGTPVCDVPSGDCVQCGQDSDCSAALPACHEQAHTCGDCNDAIGCAWDGACADGVCPPDTYGQACAGDDDCSDPQACCTEKQCVDTCATPCDDDTICPVGTACTHDYCLVQCNNDDADCAAFPGYTCQHIVMGVTTVCEND